MSRKANTPESPAEASAPASPPPSVLEGVSFTAPVLRIVADTLGRYLRHDEGCPSEACTCGLVSAVAEIQRRELLFRRYGME